MINAEGNEAADFFLGEPIRKEPLEKLSRCKDDIKGS
jgi:hypothetical protein